MTYTLTNDPNTIIRDADNAFLPTDNGNADYQAYLAWVAEGNTPTPVTPPAVVVPPEVSNYQARAQLIADGNFASVDATIRNSGNQTAIQAWDYANNFYRVSAFIDLFKAATPYNTEALVDQFFIRANQQK